MPKIFLPVLILSLLGSACLPINTQENNPTTVVTFTSKQAEITNTPFPAAIPSPTPTPVPTRVTPQTTNIPGYPPSKPAGNDTAPEQTAIDDLAVRLQVSPTSIRLVETFPDEFPASNLGCPVENGTALPIPAIVSGQVIVLEHDQTRYIYHARAGEVIYCGED